MGLYILWTANLLQVQTRWHANTVMKHNVTYDKGTNVTTLGYELAINSLSIFTYDKILLFEKVAW